MLCVSLLKKIIFMKANFRISMATAIVLIVCAMHGYGQTGNCTAYWVIEGNIYRPNYTLIRYYSNDHVLIQEERLSGRLLDIRKKKDRDFLDRKLNELKCPKMEENTVGLKPKKRIH
jgi:hypothetical protein